MNHSLVGYSPYRNALRQAKLQDSINQQPKTATVEMIKFQLSPSLLITLMFVVIMGLGALYLMNFNKVATKGYILKRLEISRQELQQQSDLKTLSLADAKAMNQIIASGAIDHMRKPGEVAYVFNDSVLAKAD